MTDIQRISIMVGALTGLTLSMAVIPPRLFSHGGEVKYLPGGWVSLRGVAFEMVMMALGALSGLMVGSLFE